MDVSVDQLKEAVKGQHGGKATLISAEPVKETFNGKTVWEGTVHVFDLEGRPKATRAYAWSSPMEGSNKHRFMPCCILAALDRRWTQCERLSWLSKGRGRKHG